MPYSEVALPRSVPGIVYGLQHYSDCLLYTSITSGMPIFCRVAFKPTPSIAKEQKTVDLQTMEQASLVVAGRHDPCIVPRAVPVVEAVTALVLADMMLEGA